MYFFSGSSFWLHLVIIRVLLLSIVMLNMKKTFPYINYTLFSSNNDTVAIAAGNTKIIGKNACLRESCVLKWPDDRQQIYFKRISNVPNSDVIIKTDFRTSEYAFKFWIDFICFTIAIYLSPLEEKAHKYEMVVFVNLCLY